MKALFLAFVFCAQVFAVSDDAIEAYTESILEIFPEASRAQLEDPIKKALKTVDKSNIKLVVRLTKATLRAQGAKIPMTNFFVEGLIMGINVGIAQPTDRDPSPTTAASELATRDHDSIHPDMPTVPDDPATIKQERLNQFIGVVDKHLDDQTFESLAPYVTGNHRILNNLPLEKFDDQTWAIIIQDLPAAMATGASNPAKFGKAIGVIQQWLESLKDAA